MGLPEKGAVRKLERIEARLRPEQKSRMEDPARLRGTSLSDFMVEKADEAARQTIEAYETWHLAGRDRQLFVDSLLNPPQPGARLRSAARRYRRTIQHQ